VRLALAGFPSTRIWIFPLPQPARFFVDPSIHLPVSVGAVIFSRDIFLASIYSAEADSFAAPGSAPRLWIALCGGVAYDSCSLPALSRRHQLSQWPRPHFVFPPVYFDLILGCCTREHFVLIQECAGLFFLCIRRWIPSWSLRAPRSNSSGTRSRLSCIFHSQVDRRPWLEFPLRLCCSSREFWPLRRISVSLFQWPPALLLIVLSKFF
jgi:hypothetical protein